MTTRPADIADLRLVRLQKLIERFTTPPNLLFSNMFQEQNADSDTIQWESRIGSRGLTPFVAPGARAPLTAPVGVGAHEAKAAFWKEKVFFGEELLNNLRQPGTRETYEAAQRRLAREMQNLQNRCVRRKEWMFAQMFAAGSFSYYQKGGVQVAVSYGVPSENVYDLGSTRKWNAGSATDILEDIMTMQLTARNSNGGELVNAICTSEVLRYMVTDPGLQALLQKSAYGNGDLYVRPKEVLGSLLNIKNLIVYDEQYQVRGWLTANITGSSTTVVYLDEVVDFVAGDTVRFYDPVNRAYEDETISSVDYQAGTITIATAPVLSFKAGACFAYSTRKFIPNNRFIMFADEIEGTPTAEFMNAPFGLGRSFGMVVDQKEEWDPDGIFIRVQNKGLPVLYNNDAIVSVKVIL